MSDNINWDQLKNEYVKLKGQIKLKDLAAQHGVKYSTLRSRKNRESWDDLIKPEIKENKSVATKKKKNVVNVATIERIESNPDLTEKQKLFCLNYVKSFNATQAALNAGYSPDTAHVIGHENLNKPKIATEIKRLKGSMTQDLYVDALDVIKMYMKIAFTDITDYIQQGHGVRLKDNRFIDGTIIKEIKENEYGVTFKLEDRMKALEKLEKYFDLIPDKWKRDIESKKLDLEQEKLEVLREKAGFNDNDDDDETGVVVLPELLEGEE